MKKVILFLILALSCVFAQAQTTMPHYRNLYSFGMNERGQKTYVFNEQAFQQVAADAMHTDSCIVTFPNYYKTDSVTVKIAYRGVISQYDFAFRLRQAHKAQVKSAKSLMSIPNDAPSNARVLQNGVSSHQSGMNNATEYCSVYNCNTSVAAPADNDDAFFKFTLTAASSVTIRVDPSSGYDPMLILRGSQSCSNILDCSDDGGSRNPNGTTGNGMWEEITISLQAGTYYAGVANYDAANVTTDPLHTTDAFDIIATWTTPTGGGCSITTSAVQLQPATAGQNNGSAKGTSYGGTGQYNYAWDNGENTRIATALSVGVHTVIATDVSDSNCTASASVTITQTGGGTGGGPDCTGFSVSATATTDTNNSDNGSATATASGGTSPYTYDWGSEGTGRTITNIGAGTYTVVATDAGGCSTTTTVTVQNQPCTSFNITLSATKNLICTGESTTLTTSGTWATYEWSNGSTSGGANFSAGGTYSVIVTDAYVKYRYHTRQQSYAFHYCRSHDYLPRGYYNAYRNGRSFLPMAG
jgi:hypothetical protein